MANRRLGAAALAAVVALAGCATDRKVQASSEVIYEEPPGAGSVLASAPSDPFEGCEAKQQPPTIVLACGSVIAAFIQLPQSLSPAQVEQNFQGFEASFPEQSTRERFSQKFGDLDAFGARVYENSPVAPFRSDMVIVPLAEGATRILSCRVTGSVDWTRCGRIAAELAAAGVPQRFLGAVAPATDTVGRDGGIVPQPEHSDGAPRAPDTSSETTTLKGPR
jgi:hypothetical protein